MFKTNDYFPNLFQSIILSLLVIFFSLFFSFLISFIDTNNSVLIIWMNIPVFLLTFVIGLFWSKKTYKNFLKNKKIQPILLIPIFLASMGTIIILGEITNVLFYFYPIPDYIIETFQGILSNKWGIIAAIFVASITEELLFRGMILTGLRYNYDYWTSIILSSILFGLIHVIPWQIIPAIFAGIFLGWIYLEFESIILCICIHAFNNAIVALPEYYEINIPGIIYDIKEGVQFQPIWLNFLGITMFIYGIIIINKKT